MRRWAGSCGVSTALHAVLAALLLGETISFGAKAPGSGGIEVLLGPMGAGGGAAAAGTPSGENAPTAAQASGSPAPVLQAVLDEPPEPPDPEAIQQQVAKKKPAPIPQKPRTEKPAPPASREETAQRARDDRRTSEAKGDATGAETRGTDEDTGASGVGRSSAAGRGEGTNSSAGGPGGGVPGMSPSYFAQLQGWLERHKDFPRAAQLRRQQGTARLYFVIDREGKVLDYRLEKSSGHELLDREVLAMIRRASPVPPMPEDMTETRLEVVVPVRFFLR